MIGGANLRLVGDDGTWSPGDVPPGAYRIEYDWADGRTRRPSATLVVGETVEVRCDAVSEVCRW